MARPRKTNRGVKGPQAPCEARGGAPLSPDGPDKTGFAVSPEPARGFQHSCTVSEREQGVRLDRFLAERFKDSGLSREKIKRLIREGKTLRNGLAESSPKTVLAVGDCVSLQAETPSTALEAEEGHLEILYRDEALAVLNKPAGLTVHPAPGRPTGTLAHLLLSHFPELAAQEGFRPGIVHRLDKDTSGLILVALTEQCRLALAGQFARHEVYKEYLALVRGVPERSEETIDAPIGRHPTLKTKMAVIPGGKAAKSARRILCADPRGRFSLQAVRIFSGRTHQVRVHMQHAGHPLLGDAQYATVPARRGKPARPSLPEQNDTPSCRAERQMLHAWKLSFTHPLPQAARQAALLPEGASRDKDSFSFCCPPPQDFTDTLRTCLSCCLRVVLTGSPGCGKSLLLDFFREQGFPVFSADAEVARLYAPGGDGQRLLRSSFGDRFVPGTHAPVDKAALGAAMRENASVRRDIEALLHPLVWHATDAFWRRHERDAALCVAEIPLYLESGRNRTTGPDAPVLVGVHCPFSVRKERLERIRGWHGDVIAGMEAWQWPEDKKMRVCDLVVDNTGSLADFSTNAAALLADLKNIRLKRQEAALQRFTGCWSV